MAKFRFLLFITTIFIIFIIIIIIIIIILILILLLPVLHFLIKLLIHRCAKLFREERGDQRASANEERVYKLDKNRTDDALFRRSYEFKVSKQEERKDAILKMEHERELLKLQQKERLSLTQGEKKQEDGGCCIL